MISSTTCETTRRRLIALACAASLGLAASAASAAPPADDPVAAEALFKAARALVEAGKYAEGCPKFEASLALHPSASTMLNIAQCHEHEGKLATAWEDYHKALTLNRETQGEQRRKGLEAIANKGIAALDPKLPRLRVVVEGAPQGLEVFRDGKALPAGALGEPLPADPGPHEVRVTAPGHKEETRSVTLSQGKTETLTLTLTRQDGAPSEKGGGKPGGGGVPTWAWVTGAVGLGLTGASVFFLVDDLSAIDALRSNCRSVRGGTYCNPGYDHAADNARKNRDFGLFVGLGAVGVAAMSVAIVGIVQSGSSKKGTSSALAVPWVAPGSAGVSLAGSF
jgi:hypothetical protein